MIDTTYRTGDAELMDDFSMEGEHLHDALDKIATINHLLGGNKITVEGVKILLKNIDTSRTISIVDLGCGNGDMLRVLANFARKQNLKFNLTGIDANAYTINVARKMSTEFSNINYLSEDIFSPQFDVMRYDIALCTLTLHHFHEEELLKLLGTLNKNAAIGIVINDLQRSAIAYRLFQFVSFVFRLKRMPKEDGLTSILRGFKKNELINFSEKLNLTNYKIRWKWAFRYQWIISKT